MNIYHHFFFDSFFLKQNFKMVFKSQKSFRTLGIIKNCFFPRNKSFRIACNNCKVIMRTFPFSGHITTNGHCICLVDMRRYFHDTLLGENNPYLFCFCFTFKNISLPFSPRGFVGFAAQRTDLSDRALVCLHIF